MSIENLISTSVSDAKGTLEHQLKADPLDAARTALELLERLRGSEGQVSRRKMAASILRQAAKPLALEEEKC